MIPIHVTNGDRVGVLEGIDLSMDWTGAACIGDDPELWFPKPQRFSQGQSRIDWDTPRSICETCPIRERCLDYAMRNEAGFSLNHRAGMYGGKTPVERAAMDPERRHTGPVVINHGTEAGARRHRLFNEKPCDACRLGERAARIAREARRAV